MSRLIPQWIGNVKVPENRDTTIQLISCWAQLVGEVANVKPLIRKLSDKMTEQSFVLRSQEIVMHLSGALEEKGFKHKNKTEIYVGNPETAIGYFNARIATVMHVFFDEPDVKLRKPCIPCPGEIE